MATEPKSARRENAGRADNVVSSSPYHANSYYFYFYLLYRA